MADRTFINGDNSNPVTADWLTDINNTVYRLLGDSSGAGGTGGAPVTRADVLTNLGLSSSGTTAQRPASPALWQMYGDDTLGQPIWATTITPSVIWTNAAGGVV